jgi:hypothetical protein
MSNEISKVELDRQRRERELLEAVEAAFDKYEDEMVRVWRRRWKIGVKNALGQIRDIAGKLLHELETLGWHPQDRYPTIIH